MINDEVYLHYVHMIIVIVVKMVKILILTMKLHKNHGSIFKRPQLCQIPKGHFQ